MRDIRHTCIYTYTHVHIRIQDELCMYESICICLRFEILVYIYTYRHTYIYICIYICIYLYIHTCIHACIHTYIPNPSTQRKSGRCLLSTAHHGNNNPQTPRPRIPHPNGPNDPNPTPNPYHDSKP